MLRTGSFVAVAVATALLTTACGSSGSGASTSTTSPSAAAPSASGTPADAATLAAIDKAFATFFASSSTLQQSQAALQNGAKFTKTLAAEGRTSYAQKSSGKVQSARLISPNVAAVMFTVSSGGIGLPSSPGYAVKTGDTWQVAAQTFCGLLKLQQQAPAACDDPAVIALPH